MCAPFYRLHWDIWVIWKLYDIGASCLQRINWEWVIQSDESPIQFIAICIEPINGMHQKKVFREGMEGFLMH